MNTLARSRDRTAAALAAYGGTSRGAVIRLLADLNAACDDAGIDFDSAAAYARVMTDYRKDAA